MYAAERQEQILARARALGRVEVATLAKELGVTPETIRRDLSTLVAAGALRRAHGGAIPVERLASFEPEISSRETIMAAEKARIAKAALGEIPDQGTIFIEAGSTPGALAEVLPDRPLTVVTTGLAVATALTKRPKLTVLMVGGRIRGRTLAAVDDWAMRDLSSARVDVAFLGTNGFSTEDGLTTPDVAEAAIKRAALSIGGRTILLADHTKFGAASLCRYGDLSDIDLLITDALPDHAIKALPGLAVRQA
jgi:DeoR family fructose operon transcriptional repressor